MERMRTPLQGVSNVIRFNWHFYVIAAASLLLIYALAHFQFLGIFHACIICFFIVAGTFTSVLVSYYVYDLSALYTLNWLDNHSDNNTHIVNIHAGFDETSSVLKARFVPGKFSVFDFYDPAVHTEVSIKRARKAYPPFPDTEVIHTSSIPIGTGQVDKVFVIFSAHEIRQDKERELFFSELKRIIKPDGEIILTEHLRDMPNFIAYNIGFFHFLSRSSWLSMFASTQLKIEKELKITPFVSTFILRKI